MKKGESMKNLMAIPVLCLLFLFACANTNQHPTPSSSSYDGIWEGYAQTPEGLYSVKMEIKNGSMSGFIEDTKISGYIDADNKLVTKPFYFKGVSTTTRVVGKTEHMSPDRIEGSYIVQVAQSSKYKWFVERPGTDTPDNTISNIKINEKEPWTGKFKLEPNYQCSGIWAMKQEGQTVKSTSDSEFDFTGMVKGNQLKGKVVGTSSTYYDFIIEMRSNNMSFTGALDLIAHGLPCQLKGKRIE